MEDWKNTKCGTCIIQRQKPICNSCLGHQFYKPMSNADKIRNMNDEELADYIFGVSVGNAPCVLCSEECDFCELTDEECKAKTLAWLQSEVKEGDV